MKITHKTLDKALLKQEALEKKGRDLFNNTSLPYEERQKGLQDYQDARDMLHEIGSKRIKLNKK
jgi:hypothetical protein